jgi:NADH:ubiquinone oxidoreductase subunit C
MESQKIVDKLKDKFSEAIVETNTEVLQPFVRVNKEALINVCKFLNSNDELLFDYLMCLSGVDWKDS